MKTQEFPIRIGRRLRVSIYEVRTRKSGHDYVNYTVAFCYKGDRVRKAFSDLAEAKDYAAARATELNNGQASVLSFSAKAGSDYAEAAQLLKPFQVSLVSVAEQFVKLKEILGEFCPLDAARQFARANRGVKQNVTVGEAVEAVLKDRELNGVSQKYLYNLRRTLHRFAFSFQETPLASLDTQTIKDFLDRLDCRRCPHPAAKKLPKERTDHPRVSARTRNNYRAAVGLLFEHARFQKWLPRDHESIEHIAEYKQPPKATEIYTPAEIDMLLTNAAAVFPELLPFLAIGAFAGIRHEEIIRLDWKDIFLDEKHITVQAGNAKTAARRVVPIAGNLARWLAPFAKPFGPVCYRQNMAEPLSRFIESKPIRNTGFVWKRNALRHSFISYRLAETNDIARVALEAGNSPHMIHQHYKQLVTAEAAKAWFAVQPVVSENVLEMQVQQPPAEAKCA